VVCEGLVHVVHVRQGEGSYQLVGRCGRRPEDTVYYGHGCPTCVGRGALPVFDEDAEAVAEVVRPEGSCPDREGGAIVECEEQE
jgi:hypothetical protein